MSFKVAIHAQRGGMGSHFSQQPAFNKKPQVVIDRSQRNGWDATPHRAVNVFRRMGPVRSDTRFVHYLSLVRDRQAVLRRQLTEVFMGKTHYYRIRMIIEQPEPNRR